MAESRFDLEASLGNHAFQNLGSLRAFQSLEYVAIVAGIEDSSEALGELMSSSVVQTSGADSAGSEDGHCGEGQGSGRRRG